MDIPTTTLGVVGGFIVLVLTIIKVVVSNEAKKKADEEKREKEIHEAIASGDISRINAVIGKLRK